MSDLKVSLDRSHDGPKAKQSARLFRGVNWGLAPVALIVLAIGVAYAYLNAYVHPFAGFSYDRNAIVIAVTACNDFYLQCDPGSTEMHVGDRLLSVGGISADEFILSQTSSPLAGYQSGDVIPITLERQGQSIELSWLLHTSPPYLLAFDFLLSVIAFLPFWAAGSAILLSANITGQHSRLFGIFAYGTALWLIFGLASSPNIAGSSTLLHIFSWLLLPIYVHLHLLLPVPLGTLRQRRLVLVVVYVIGVTQVITEALAIFSQNAFVIGLLSAVASGFVILVLRLVRRPPAGIRVPSQLMFVGWSFAFLPSLLTWFTPTLSGASGTNLMAISVSLAGLPTLPLFYLYALYKHRLGRWEARVNRILRVYTLLWIYLAIAVIVTEWLSVQLEDPNQVFVGSLTATMLILLAGYALRQSLVSLGNRLAYGVRYHPEELFRQFAALIPTAVERERLAELLLNEVTPALGVTQSALYELGPDHAHLLYEQLMPRMAETPSTKQVSALSSGAGRFLPDGDPAAFPAPFDWVRLVIEVRMPSARIGLWLFGSRAADDFYSDSDIALLQTLANQIGVTLQNTRLLQQVQEDLRERERVQRVIQGFASRLQLMHNIDRAILQASSPADIAREAAERLLTILPAVRVSVVVFEEPASKGRLLAAAGNTKNLLQIGELVPLSSRLAAPDSDRLTARIVPDISQMGGDAHLVSRALEAGVRALVMIPLSVDKEAIGLLNIGLAELAFFEDEHQAIAEEVGRSVAVALHNARLMESLTHLSAELRRLSAQLIDAQERERQRLARELHDEMGQTLTAISLDLGAIENAQLARGSDESVARVADAKALIQNVIQQVRSLSFDLSPSLLKDFGLRPALEWLVEMQQERTNLAIGLQLDGLEGRMPDELETAVYRIVQEGLTNVARHASAKQVLVSLKLRSDRLRIQIVDDGIGFDQQAHSARRPADVGAGLLGMRERAFALGGRLDLKTDSGQGTRIDIEIPLESQT